MKIDELIDSYPCQVRYGDGVVVNLTSQGEGAVIISPTEHTQRGWPVGYHSVDWQREYTPKGSAEYNIVEILG